MDKVIRAERRIGEFSKELPLNRGDEKFRSSHNGKTDILKEAGIKHHERYESIANLPQKEFEEHIERVKQSNDKTNDRALV